MTPKKPDWFELTEGGDPSAGIRKIDKKLPIVTLVVAGAIVLGGSIFATANNEPSAVAETPTSSQTLAASQSATTDNSSSASTSTSTNGIAPAGTSAKTSSGLNSLPAPTVGNVPQRGDRDHEGREDGEHRERGEHGEGDRYEHDDDD